MIHKRETMVVWHPKKGKLIINVRGSEAFIKKHKCKLEDPKAKKDPKAENNSESK